MTTKQLRPGTIVRLSFDQGPRSYGVVLHGLVHLRDDGTRLVPTVWGDDREPAEEISALVDEIGPADEVNGVHSMRLAETILTPLCEHVDTFADEWGLACSEPDVPTTITIPCRYDATRTLTLRTFDGEGLADVPFNLCTEHAALYRAGVAEEIVADEAI